jgi:PIN domain nuclease of toxin-antitoxin system
MNLLLDTHVFLWYVANDARLRASHRDAIRDPANAVYVSVASLWEAIIKHDLGKLPLPGRPSEYLAGQREAHGLASLPIDEGAMAYVEALPGHHRDPFDRLMIAQALQHQLTIATVDAVFSRYDVPSLT